MDPLSRALVRRFGPAEGTITERKAAYGLLEGWIGLVLNAVLFVVKLALGLLTGSVALIADAVHTLADSITSGVLIGASRMARKPADREHPFGHGRIESVAAIVIAVLLGVAGVEFLESSIHRVLHPQPVDAGWWVVAVVVAAAAIKEWNSRFALGLAEESGSTAIAADAWHHRSDVFATLLVAVGIVGSKLGLPILDGVMGLGVSLVILWSALAIAREAIDPLIGKAPTPEEIREIAEIAQAVEGVQGVHDIVIHSYGDVRLVSLHVETSDQESALELHTLAETVQSAVAGAHGHAVVHVDPINRDHVHYAQIHDTVSEVIEADARLHSFHDLRIIGSDDHYNVVLDVIRARADGEDDGVIAQQVGESIRERTEARAVVVSVEPLFAYG
jgi:cation diffusion facilitator family transporter